MAGCCERGNESLGSVKCGEIVDQLRGYQLPKIDSAPLRKMFLCRGGNTVTLPVIQFRVWCSHLNTWICFSYLRVTVLIPLPGHVCNPSVPWPLHCCFSTLIYSSCLATVVPVRKWRVFTCSQQTLQE